MDKLLAEHGKDCRKEEHRGGGYLHTPDDDTPYDVDGVAYCGRCHWSMDSRPQETRETDKDVEVEHARVRRIARIAVESRDEWLIRAKQAESSLATVEAELEKLEGVAQESDARGVKLIQVSRELVDTRKGLERVRLLIPKWRAEGAQIDTFHATMGTGYKVCADELYAALQPEGKQP